MTRAEHIAWCKVRAKQEFEYYLKETNVHEAIRHGLVSMMSDLTKHPETNNAVLSALCFQQLIDCKSAEAFREFINGFN